MDYSASTSFGLSTTMPPSSSPSSFLSGKEEVVRDLLAALEDMNQASKETINGDHADDHQLSTSYCDVKLVCQDDKLVSSNRFVLAARSPVLRKMLYGPFKEATTNRIEWRQYDSTIVKAIVQYCCTNTVSLDERFGKNTNTQEAKVRKMVELYKAADYLELMGLQQCILFHLRQIMTTQLQYACVVFDATNPHCELFDMALHILETRPYMALDHNDNNCTSDGGGIVSLTPHRLLTLYKSPAIGCGEVFLFRMLKRWYEYHHRDKKEDKNHRQHILDVAHQASKHIQWVNIEPQILLDRTIQTCPFVTPELIFAAVSQQALKASLHRTWIISGRGKSTVERLLVEGLCSGTTKDAQGLYYKVVGLANGGGLYTKREISCGQVWVYTLSCAIKSDRYEGRLFRSKLLTYNAVLSLAQLQHQSSIDPVFQPVLQVLSLQAPPPSTFIDNGNGGEAMSLLLESHHSYIPSPIRKYYRARISDGDYHMHATFSTGVMQKVALHSSESNVNDATEESLSPGTLVKVLEYGLYSMDGYASIHITKLSIVNTNPGQFFGNPQPLPKTDESLVSLWSNQSNTNSDTLESEFQNPVQLLYSCSCPVDVREPNAPCPRLGWKSEAEEGQHEDPCLTVTWIPATTTPAASATAASTATTMRPLSAAATASSSHNTTAAGMKSSRRPPSRPRSSTHRRDRSNLESQQLGDDAGAANNNNGDASVLVGI